MEFGFCVEIISCLFDLKIRCLKIAEVKKKVVRVGEGSWEGVNTQGESMWKLEIPSRKKAIQNVIILRSATA